MNNPTAKQMLFNLMTHFELQFCENMAMKTILKECPDASTRDSWQANVQRIVSDPELMKVAHALFVPIYDQIEAMSDEESVLELLSKLPATGKAN
jgi:hypothetical protein